MSPSPAVEVRKVCKAFPVQRTSSGIAARFQHYLQKGLNWRPSRSSSRKAWQVAGILAFLIFLEKSVPLLRAWLYHPANQLSQAGAWDRHLEGTDGSGHATVGSTSHSSAGSAGATSSAGSSGHGVAHQHDALFFLFIGLVVGTSVTHLTTLRMFHGVQQTVVMFVLGVSYSMFFELSGLEDKLGVFGRTYSMWMEIDPHLILFTMLPALLTGDAMTLDTRIAERVAKQCIYLASVGVCINAVVVALFLRWYLPYNWDFLLSLTTGAILCATDPVAVVALLKELGASPTLTVLIQGESLLNDGTAIVLYTIPYNMLLGKDYGISDVIIFLVKQCMCAWILGMFIGAAFLTWICCASSKLDHHNIVIQVSLTLCCAYWSFIIAEGVFHISGVLATVAAALVLAHSMWPRVVSKKSMHDFWEMLEYLGNTIIFFLAGALTGKTMAHIPWIDYGHLLVIYVVLILVRAVLLLFSRPLLRVLSETKQPVSLAELIVMTWGGLRGAVGLALAIIVKKERAGGGITPEDADRVMFFVGGIAALTLVVNATTSPSIVRTLGITAMPETRRKMLLMMHKQLLRVVSHKMHTSMTVCPKIQTMLTQVETNLSHSKQHGFQCWPWLCRQKIHPTEPEADKEEKKDDTANPANPAHLEHSNTTRSNFNVFGNLNTRGPQGHIMDMFRGMFNHEARAKMCNDIADEYVEVLNLTSAIEESDLLILFQFAKIPVLVNADELQDLLNHEVAEEKTSQIIREVFLVIVRSFYFNMMETGDIKPGSPEADALFGSVTQAMDKSKIDMDDFRILRDGWLLKSKALARARGTTAAALIIGAGRTMGKTVRSTWLIAFINLTIIGHSTFTLLEEAYRKIDDTSVGWVVADALFVSVFIVECFLKLLDEGLAYFRKSWNLFDFGLVLLGIFCLIINIFMAQLTLNQEGEVQILQVARILRVLRLIRLCRVLKNLHVFADKHLYSKDFQVASRVIRDHMYKIKVLTQFVKAHLAAVDELMYYFGTETVEVARCVLQSHVAVHRAVLMAVREEHKLDHAVVREIAHLRTSHHLTDKLEEFLLDAHHGGILAPGEAEHMVKSLREHLMVTKKQIRKSINRMSKSATGQKQSLKVQQADESAELGLWSFIKKRVFRRGATDGDFSTISVRGS